MRRQFFKLLSNLSFVKLICALLILLALVQILYVLRLSQPNSYHYQQILERLPWHKQQSRNTTSLVKQCVSKLKTVHIMDWTGMYYIVPNFIQAINKAEKETENSVTVCVHTTPNHLNYLIDLARIWNGPISVSVFAHRNNIDRAIKTIINLHMCNKLIRQFVSFHIVFPIHYAKKYFDAIYDTIDCENAILNSFKTDMNYMSKEGPYPSNTLRNVAIENTQTNYILVLDIDIYPSENLHKQFQYFLQRQNRKSKSLLETTAFVLPCFESSKSMDAEEINKDTLKLHVTDGSIRPFYIKACEICQIDTDFSRWLEFPSMGFLETAYEVEWAMSWEPFYIADKTHLPLYDSRFKQYGYNRVSQICEAYLTGFRFMVLNNGFLVHRGFKDSDSFHANKTEEHKHNRELFNIFKIEMKDRYPDVSRRC